MSSARLLRASSQAAGIHHFSTCSSFWVRTAEMKCTPISNPDYNQKSYSTVAMVATAPSESLKTSSSDQMTAPSEPWGSRGDIDLVSLVKMVMVVTFKPAVSVGTAMLVFGVGIHAMFVDSMSKRHTRIPDSNLFGLFHLQHLPAWVETRSISEAKSRIGHAVVMILQVGLVEKFKSVPLITSFDLACFAAAILVSSASTFLLSKLYTLNH